MVEFFEVLGEPEEQSCCAGDSRVVGPLPRAGADRVRLIGGSLRHGHHRIAEPRIRGPCRSVLLSLVTQEHDIRVNALAADGKFGSVRRPPEPSDSRARESRELAARRAVERLNLNTVDAMLAHAIGDRRPVRCEPDGFDGVQAAPSGRRVGDAGRGISIGTRHSTVVRADRRHHREKLAVWRPSRCCPGSPSAPDARRSTARSHTQDLSLGHERHPVTIRRAGRYRGDRVIGELFDWVPSR